MTQKPLDLTAIKARDKARTQGKWLNEQQIVGQAEPRLINCPEGECTRFLATNMKSHDADFIAACSVDIPTLVAEVERLRKEEGCLLLETAQMRAILEEVASDYTRRVGRRARALLGKE